MQGYLIAIPIPYNKLYKRMFSRQQTQQQNKTTSSKRDNGNLVPPLLQIGKRSKKDSPNSSLVDSDVSSQYIYDSSEVPILNNRFAEAQQDYTPVTNLHHRFKFQINPIINENDNKFQWTYQNEKQAYNPKFEQKSMKNQMNTAQKDNFLKESLPPTSQLDYQLNSVSQEASISSPRIELEIYNSAIQMLNNLTTQQLVKSESLWLTEKPPQQLLAYLLSNSNRLTFYLQRLQHLIVQKKDDSFRQNVEILSFLLIKLITRKNKSGDQIRPEIYLNQFGIKIDFEPSPDWQRKRQKIQQLRRSLQTKEIQISNLREDYDFIIQNYAQALLNLNVSHQTADKQINFNRGSFRRSDDQPQISKLIHKMTFGHNRASVQQKQKQKQFVNSEA